MCDIVMWDMTHTMTMRSPVISDAGSGGGFGATALPCIEREREREREREVEGEREREKQRQTQRQTNTNKRPHAHTYTHERTRSGGFGTAVLPCIDTNESCHMYESRQDQNYTDTDAKTHIDINIDTHVR